MGQTASSSQNLQSLRMTRESRLLTALLLALPLAAASDITIEVVGELISKPYIEITLNLMGLSSIEQLRRAGTEVLR